MFFLFETNLIIAPFIFEANLFTFLSWYNHTGSLGIKKQISYLLFLFWNKLIHLSSVVWNSCSPIVLSIALGKQFSGCFL